MLETDSHSVYFASDIKKHKLPDNIIYDLQDSIEFYVTMDKDGNIVDLRAKYEDSLKYLSIIRGNVFKKSKPSIKNLLLQSPPILSDDESQINLGRFDIKYRNGAVLELSVLYDGEYQFEFTLFVDEIEADYLVITGILNQKFSFYYKNLKYILSV